MRWYLNLVQKVIFVGFQELNQKLSKLNGEKEQLQTQLQTQQNTPLCEFLEYELYNELCDSTNNDDDDYWIYSVPSFHCIYATYGALTISLPFNTVKYLVSAHPPLSANFLEK